MSTTLMPIITAAGLAAAFAADKRSATIAISHIGLGNGINDEGYIVATDNDGLATQTALKSEQQRVAVQDGKSAGPHQVDLSFLVDGDSAYWVRELGFYLDDGTLFAVWSDADRPMAYKSGSVPLVVGLGLTLSALPADSVTVQAAGTPLQLVMTEEITAINNSIAELHAEQVATAQAHATQLQTHSDELAAQAAQDSKHDTLLQTHSDTIANLTNTTQAHATQLQTHSKSLADQATQDNKHDLLLQTHTDTLADLTNTAKTHATQLQTHSDAIAAQQTKDNEHTTAINALQNRVDALGATIILVNTPQNIRLASSTNQIVSNIAPPSYVPTNAIALFVDISTFNSEHNDHVVHSFGRNANHSHEWANNRYNLNTYFNDLMITHEGDSAGAFHYGHAHGTHILPLKSNGKFDANICHGWSRGTHYITLQVIGYII